MNLGGTVNVNKKYMEKENNNKPSIEELPEGLLGLIGLIGHLREELAREEARDKAKDVANKQPETITIRVQLSKDDNQELEFKRYVVNLDGVIYINEEHKRFHIIGDKVKCIMNIVGEFLANNAKEEKDVETMFKTIQIVRVFSKLHNWTEA
jgi:hypothetical protein